jgi:hypothetical protein
LVIAYSQWDDWQREAREAEVAENQRRQVMDQGVDTYLGVRLGMSKNEVRYLLGRPSSSEETDSGEYEQWRYKEGSKTRKRVLFDNSAKVRIVTCQGDYSFECPELLGIRIGDAESELMRVLGEPATPPKINEQGMKWFLYGPPTGRVAFDLAQGVVRRMSVALILSSPPDDQTATKPSEIAPAEPAPEDNRPFKEISPEEDQLKPDS